MLQSIQLTATNRSRAYPMRLIEYDGLLLELFLGYVVLWPGGSVG